MNPIIYIFLASLAIMLASLSGVLFLNRTMNKWLHRNLRFLISFSMGVFIVITYQLIAEILHESINLIPVIAWIVGGIIIVEIFTRLIPDDHHHHDTTEHDHDHSRIDARRMLFGDAVHNIGDGILLTSAFLVDIYVGIIATLAIFIHELAQETSQFFILKQAGYSTRQALARNLIVSSSIIVGVLLTFLISFVHAFEVPLLSIAAGSFISVIFRDLLPHTIGSIKRHKKLSMHIIAGILGAAVMISIGMLVAHSHEDHNDSDEHLASDTALF
jgi:zinc and cadmium transporter